MASAPFPGAWLPTAQFSGNSDFVLDSNGAIWLVANSTTAGVAIYSSTDHGATFSEVATIPGASSTTLSFDPAVAIDASNVLHIVGQVQASGQGVTLQKYTFDPGSQTLSAAATLTTQGMIGSDYDIVALSNGNTYIVTSLLTGLNETVEGIELSAAGTVVKTDTLVSQQLGVGNRYGSLSLISGDGVTVEIYLCSIPKAFSFADSTATLSVLFRSPTSVGAQIALTTFHARYTADRLTVIEKGTARYLSQGYFSQKRGELFANTLLGYVSGPGSPWSFHTFFGTASSSYAEPVISVSPSGLVLGSLTLPLTAAAQGSPIALYDVDVSLWKLTPRSDFPYPVKANWLRGTKSVLPSTMPWAMVSQRAVDSVGRFYTGFSVPPVASLVPATFTGKRGVPAEFDASGSFDLNLHPLQYSWSLTDATGMAKLTASGTSASVVLPATAGPAAQTITLTVSVVDVDAQGNALHPPAAASSTITYPLIPVPVIGTLEAIAADRNVQVLIAPTVTVSPSTTPTYSWAQIGGTAIHILSATNTGSLSIETNGAAVDGETLTFTLTVSDGVNVPVTGTFTVDVAARTSTGESTRLARTAWAGNISQRNSAAAWAAPTQSSTVTQFHKVKRSPVVVRPGGSPTFAQTGSYLLIGASSVTIQRNGETWHAYPPVTTETVLDAVHAFSDETIVLTSSQKLLRFVPGYPAVDTDHVTGTILLDNISPATYTTLDVTAPFAGARVLVLTSTQGVLLLEIDADFNVTGTHALNGHSGTLYGAANAKWVRLADVESLHTGSLLIGTSDADGHTFETEYSLATRSVVGVFDSSSLQNQTVATGEMLFTSVDSYSGIPLPAVLSSPTVSNGSVVLSWQQSRPDLATGYQVWAVSGGAARLAATVSSGAVNTVALRLAPGKTYSVHMVTTSADGNSADSNAVVVTL